MNSFSIKRRLWRRLALGAAFAALLAPSPGVAAPAERPAAAPDARREVSPELGKILQPVQQAIREQRFADALTRLGEADKIAKKTPYENGLILHLRAVAAIGSRDATVAAAAVTAVTTAGGGNFLSPAERLPLILAVAGLAFDAKDYAGAIEWATRHRQSGGGAADTRAVLTQAYFHSGDFAAAAAELQAEIAESDKAGRPVAETQLQLLANIQARRNDDAGYLATLERLTAAFGRTSYWSELIQRETGKADFPSRLRLDVLRLRQAAGVLQAPGEHVEWIELALRSGTAGEAKTVAGQGLAAGALGNGAEGARHRRLAAAADRAAADEWNGLPAQEAAAVTGPALATVGGVYLGGGQPQKAAALLEKALTLGDVKRPEDVRLRLAQAYWAAGERDKAIQTLKAVRGDDGAATLARLWLIRAARP